MADELSRAISFANGYFVLADGLVPDLEEHLAEDVVLDWFGQTIEGRYNVATFMKYQKISSRHIFNEVNPATAIGYRKQRPLRKYYSIGGTHTDRNLFAIRNKTNDYVEDGDGDDDDDDDDDENYQIKYKRQCFSDGIIIENLNKINDESTDNNNDTGMDCDDESEYEKMSLKLHDNNKIQNKNISNISMECNLNFDKLKLDADNFSTPKEAFIKQRDFLDSDEVNCALNVLGDKIKLKSELKATNIMEIEKKIAQLKDKESVEFIKMELGQGDGPSIYETNSIKYIEACGVIEFSRFFNTKQIRKDIRKRLCRLQIAYSSKNNNKDLNKPINESNRESVKQMSSMEMDEKKVETMPKKLKSLKELRQLSNNLIPFDENKIDSSTDDDDNVDDISNERNKFLKCLKLNPMDNNDGDNTNDLVTPKYVRHQLTFDKSPERLLAGSGDTRGFVFNHIIHFIIYESNTKCRLNLSHEFENKEISDN
ncbi:hypothetical protein PV325_002659 [Microctonus aethiopoides]|nr:hypothetical protein PV325_002659 [Microctonus aethiopoides]